MKTKLSTSDVFLLIMLIPLSVVAIGFGILVHDSHQKHNGICTFEGLECPTALNQYLTDSVAYADAEFIIDSLQDANESLQIQLAGCEQKDHSRIPTVSLTVTTLDTNQADWSEYNKYFVPTVSYAK